MQLYGIAVVSNLTHKHIFNDIIQWFGTYHPQTYELCDFPP